ncbi:hypothetical protein CMO89_03535 [Candidatus Woesearchaeota archaeon]|nr:hypothetical protein [Candidatus Woesearchaeota archaeon]|tara:strand:+ start:2897 stop:3154 length:258 start_codon:yes stop_codon:yes gene_type:complete
MKKIGQGLHFNVYDIGDKVEKTLTSKTQIKRKLLLWNPFYIFKLSSLEENARSVIEERDKITAELKKRKIPAYLLANLRFDNNKI